ncbi:hypothetical protein [Poseidonocella sp. HB161398]|uniref:hypothetical protein n=1 Tax=Poseidonocella sp. HB161398 TaxID=2320855 RepID=UPI001107BF43|nr:hypothetical protein [Poseidonocella sp. HB161398]
MRIAAALGIIAAQLATPLFANEFEPAMLAYLQDNVLPWASDPVLADAVAAQNADHAGLDQAQIDALDATWRAEVGGSDTPMIDAVLSGPAAEFLKAKVEASGGVISELFVTDNLGLNVAASDVTSDYWQGDEEKFTDVFGKGADAVHVGDVEHDESSQTYQGQVSVPVVDAAGAVIGTMTVGLNAELLF